MSLCNVKNNKLVSDLKINLKKTENELKNYKQKNNELNEFKIFFENAKNEIKQSKEENEK